MHENKIDEKTEEEDEKTDKDDEDNYQSDTISFCSKKHSQEIHYKKSEEESIYSFINKEGIIKEMKDFFNFPEKNKFKARKILENYKNIIQKIKISKELKENICSIIKIIYKLQEINIGKKVNSEDLSIYLKEKDENEFIFFLKKREFKNN